MTARDILTYDRSGELADGDTAPVVDAGMPIAALLPALLNAPHGRLSVSDCGVETGSIDMEAALRACSAMMPPRPESSVINVICTPAEFSASAIARAVEDADAHLLDMHTLPAPHGNLQVVLRISRMDPAGAARSLRRYGFTVSSTESRVNTDQEQSLVRLQALQRFFDI